MRLHNRLLVPFLLLTLVTAAAAGWLTLRVVGGVFETRVREQVRQTAIVIGQGGFALNPAILRSVKAITGADVVTFVDAEVLATSVPAASGGLVAAVIDAARGVPTGPQPVVVEVDCGSPCYLALGRVRGREEAVVAVIAQTSEVAAATQTVARTLVIASVVGLVVLFAASQVVAQHVTAPLDRLVEFANTVGSAPPPGNGASGARASEGDDEVGRLGQAFNRMLDRLDRSQSALVRSEKLALAGMLAARVAHDIRNPLAAIKMETQLLHGRLRADDQGRQLASEILHNITTVESVILDLIELARPGQLQLRDTSPNDVVREALLQLQAQLEHQKIRIETALADPLPSMRLDTGRLKQVLVNLMVNAAEAMPAGGAMRVATNAAPDGSTVTLEVCDDGAGIDPALAERVFDPFVSSKPGGVGLGLVNAKSVVELHGGRIELGPCQPRGTRAAIILPVGAV